MPVPVNITDLSETASINSPAGSETVGPQANDYLQALSSFIRKIYDGAIAPLAALNVNGQQIINVAQGDTSSVSNQAVTGAQLRNFSYKIGEQRWWNSHGQAILPVWGPGWQLADGTNGTLDMRNRSPVATGSLYGLGQTAGATAIALSVANIPAHAHGISDPGHIHGLGDPGHSHGVNDPGHLHQIATVIAVQGGSNVQEGTNTRQISFIPNPATDTRATGVSVAVGGTNMYMGAALTGVTTQNTGSGAAFDNRPPLMGVVCLEYTGIGA